MILVDTSAWIEYLRATESAVHHHLRDLIATTAPLAITDVVAMEVLAGSSNRRETADLGRLLERAAPLPTRPFFDHEVAARIYRTCRVGGETPRSTIDCLIAAVAIRHGVPVLHQDRDFGVIGRHTDLQIASVG